MSRHSRFHRDRITFRDSSLPWNRMETVPTRSKASPTKYRFHGVSLTPPSLNHRLKYLRNRFHLSTFPSFFFFLAFFFRKPETFSRRRITFFISGSVSNLGRTNFFSLILVLVSLSPSLRSRPSYERGGIRWKGETRKQPFLRKFSIKGARRFYYPKVIGRKPIYFLSYIHAPRPFFFLFPIS